MPEEYLVPHGEAGPHKLIGIKIACKVSFLLCVTVTNIMQEYKEELINVLSLLLHIIIIEKLQVKTDSYLCIATILQCQSL